MLQILPASEKAMHVCCRHVLKRVGVESQEGHRCCVLWHLSSPYPEPEDTPPVEFRSASIPF